MKFINIVISILYPGFSSVAAGDWDHITNKLRKSVIYFLVGIVSLWLFIESEEYFEISLENPIVPWVIVVCYALIIFSVMLFVSGVCDLIAKKYPSIGRGGALWLIVALVVVTVLLWVKILGVL